MAYELHCKECGTDISAHQYDAHLGMCPACFEDAEDLHDEDHLFDEGSPEAGQRRDIERQPYESWNEAKMRATRTPPGLE